MCDGDDEYNDRKKKVNNFFGEIDIILPIISHLHNIVVLS